MIQLKIYQIKKQIKIYLNILIKNQKLILIQILLQILLEIFHNKEKFYQDIIKIK